MLVFILILYPAIFLNSFIINLIAILWIPEGFLFYNHANKNSFTSPFLVCMPFILLVLLHWLEPSGNVK